MRLRVASLYRYPVKGLSPERLTRAALRRGDYFPGDRLFAVENGPSGFDPAAPAHQPKIKFLMLMRNEALARLETRYDDPTGDLIIAEKGREAARGNLSTREGRLAIEAFFRRFMPRELRGPPQKFWQPRTGFGSPIRAAVSSRSSIWPASRRSKPWPARRSIRCASAAISMSRGLSPGPSSTSSARRLKPPPACGSRSPSASSAARPPMSILRPVSATSRYRAC
jgi:hypothetical protein